MSDVTDAAALQAEVERLRKANASLTRKVAWRHRFRRASASGLLLLGCGLAVLSLVAIWLRVTMLDTDRYVDTVAPIAAQPAVQDAVADKLETAIFSRVDFAALSRQALPDQADVIAPAIERGLQSFISDRIVTFTRSPRFQELWTEANRRAHTRIVALLTGGRSGRLVLEGDTVYLDLSEAVNRVRDGVERARAEPARGRDPVDGRRAGAADAIGRARQCAGRCAAPQGRRDRAPGALVAVPGGRGGAGAPAAARAAVGRDRPRGLDGAADRGAGRGTLGVPRRARSGHAPARRGRRGSSTSSSRCCGTASGSWSSPPSCSR